jgi:hypothetical protein
MKPTWPTLEGRLNNAIKDEQTALEQLSTMIPLSELAKKKLEKLKQQNENSTKNKKSRTGNN